MGMFDKTELGTASLSFAGARRGLSVSGIILPNQNLGESDNEAYRRVPDYNNDGTPKTYTRSGKPILRLEFLLQTDLTEWAQTSTKFEAKAIKDFPDVVDDGVRRWIGGAMYFDTAVKKALEKLGREPEVGGRMTIKVTGHDTGTIKNGPNAGDEYTSPILDVNWEPATAEGKRVAEAYREKHFVKEDVGAGMGFSDDSGDPPF